MGAGCRQWALVVVDGRWLSSLGAGCPRRALVVFDGRWLSSMGAVMGVIGVRFPQ